ncbi:hypothetical protein KA977_00975 [Candidatus Dependentiae bacterium]|nr:hypothetical protein [Candidatus Dependentiae bacterium]
MKRFLIISILFSLMNYPLFSDNNSLNNQGSSQNPNININSIKNESQQFIDNLISNFQSAKNNYDLIIKDLNKTIEELNLKINSLNQTITNLQSENKALIEKNSVIPAQIKQIENLNKDRQSLLSEISALKGKGLEEIKALNSKLTETIESYSHSEIELKNIKTELGEKNSLISEQNNKINGLEILIKSAEKRKSDDESTINSLNSELSLLKKQLESIKLSNQLLSNQNDTLTSSNSVLQKENIFLNNRIKELNKEKEILLIDSTKNTDKISRQAAEISKFESIQIQKDNDIDFLKNTTKQQAEKIREANSEISNLNAEIKQIITDKQVLETKIKDMGSALTDYDTIILVLKQKIKENQTEIDKANAQKELFERMSKERILQNAEIDNVKNERNTLKLTLNTVNKEIDKLKTEISEKDRTIELQKIELNKLYDKLKEIVKP